MSLLILGSSNPNFSYIIAKNPDTIREKGIPFKREIRKGVVNGWFRTSTNQEFRLLFKDADNQTSFGKGNSDEFEYLDCSRYGSPLIPLSIITTSLASASKGDELDVEGYSAYIYSNIKVSRLRHLDQLIQHYQGIAQITYEYVHGRYYKVRVEAPTVYLCINVFQVICLLQSMSDPDTFLKLDGDTVGKFINILNRGNAPYYPRYLFQSKAFSNREMFEKMKSQMTPEGMTLFFGDTRQQRFDAIKAELSGGDTLIDIGCGEMFYSLKLANKYDLVFAVDADEDRSFNNSEKVKARKADTISVIHATANKEWVENTESTFTGAEVILTEVLEHIPRDEADGLLAAVLKTDFKTVVVTCPNKDFNVHYCLTEEEFRHPDHKWEPTFEEFCDDMVIFAAEAGCLVTVKGIGDEVNNQSTSLMAVFTKRESDEPNNQDDSGASSSN